MQIQLSIASPKVELPGLSTGIEQLKELKGLIDELRQVKPVEVKIGVAGIEKLGQAKQAMGEMTAFQQSLVAQLGSLGNAGSALEKLKGGFKDVGAEIKYLSGLHKQLAEMQKSTPSTNQERRSAVGNTMNVAQLRITELQAKQVEAMDKALFAAAEAEDKLTGSSKKNAKAVADQGTVVGAKAKTLDKLTAAADKATAAEAKLGKEAKKQVPIGGSGNVLTRKFVTLKDSEEGRQLTSESRQGEPGQVFVETDGALTENISSVDQLKHSLASLNAQYQANMRMANSAGASERELAKITRAHGEAVRESGVALGNHAAGASAVAQGEMLLRKAVQMESKAGSRNLKPNGNDRRSFGALQKAERDQFIEGIKDSYAMHEAEIVSNKASSQSTGEQVALLRKKADAYRFLANEARQLQQNDLSRTIERRAVGVDASATQLESSARQSTTSPRKEPTPPSGFERRSYTATQRSSADALRKSIKDDMAMHEEEIRMGKASMRADHEKISMLNQKSAAYRQLAGAAREGGQHNLARTLDKKGGALESDAVRMGKTSGLGVVGSKLLKLPETLATVTLWMGAYTIFFQGMKLLDTGLEAMIKYDAQTAQLQSVMRGSRAEAESLRDTVLDLAVATGRGGEEAMNAAIRWSRLGLSHREVAQATEISLKSASISGMSADDSTEQLSGMMASWGLTLPQLHSAFEQMNAMAVRFNASDKELMAGLQRTGALAHQMGMDMSQAMSLVSLISGTTGRPGAESGNAIKRYLTNMGKPEVQEKLALNYGVKIANDDGSLKSQRELLNELSLTYKSLNKDRQQDFVMTVAGAQQANRLAIVLADLTHAQALEVEGLMDFNRADIENATRRDTMEKDLNSLSTAWGRFWVSIGDKGGIAALKSGISTIQLLLDSVKPERIPTEKKQYDAARGLAGGFVDSDALDGLDDDPDDQRTEKDKLAILNPKMRKRMESDKATIDSGQDDFGTRYEYNKLKAYFDKYEEANATDLKDSGSKEDHKLQEAVSKSKAYEAAQSGASAALKLVKAQADLPKLSKAEQDAQAEAKWKFVEDNNANNETSAADVGASDREEGKRYSRGEKSGHYIHNQDYKPVPGLDVEDTSGTLFPENPKERSAFAQKLSEAQASGDKEGAIALIMDRQLKLKLQQIDVDKVQKDLREKRVVGYDIELKKNKELITAKEAAGEDTAALHKDHANLMMARNLVANGGSKVGDTDPEGIAPSSFKEVMQGRLRGISGVYGAMPSQRFEVDKIKREKAMIQQQIDALKDLKLTATEENALDAELQLKMKEANGREVYAGMQDRVAASGRTAHNTMSRAAIGRNEPEQQRNELRVAEASATESMRLAALDTDRTVALGRMAEAETYIASIKEMQITNDERRARLEADITNEKRRQNEEAAKALLMATREDQLRSALTARAVDRRGGQGFNANEFQFMSQGMRQSVERYNPNALPPEYMNHLRELQREKGQADALDKDLHHVDPAIRKTHIEKTPPVWVQEPQATADLWNGKGFPEIPKDPAKIDVNQIYTQHKGMGQDTAGRFFPQKDRVIDDGPTDVSTAQRLEKTLSEMPQFQLPSDKGPSNSAGHNLSSTFNFSFGDEMKALASTVSEAVRRPLQNELNNIRSMVFALTGDQGVADAQSAGQV